MNNSHFISKTPLELLGNYYSDHYFCGYDCQGDEVYEKPSIAPSGALPTFEELVTFSNRQLVTLAHRIASAYKFSLARASNVQAREYLADLPYGINVCNAKKTSLDSLCKRLCDEKWWRRKIMKLADEKREHLAHLNKELGGRNPSQTCCTDRTIEMYRERQEVTNKFLESRHKVIYSPHGEPYVFNLYEVSIKARHNRLNELFLDIKALESIALKKEFMCAFITLTAAPEFHPNPKIGKSKYMGFSAK
jgi:hypothetical protein